MKQDTRPISDYYVYIFGTAAVGLVLVLLFRLVLYRRVDESKED